MAGGEHEVREGHEEPKGLEWLDIKELTPLRFMPYVAELFRQVTGRDLKGLSDYMEWMRPNGYYHWKMVELGQLGSCLHLQGLPVPTGPIPQPSG